MVQLARCLLACFGTVCVHYYLKSVFAQIKMRLTGLRTADDCRRRGEWVGGRLSRQSTAAYTLRGRRPPRSSWLV